VKHLVQSWQAFAAACRTASHILLLADYDGTLATIVGRPADAVLSPGVRDRLSMLAKKPTYSVGVISGRSIEELKALVGIEGIYYSGNHGLEIEGPGFSFVSPEARAARPVIAGLARELAVALTGIARVIIQDKGLSLSVHYRLVKPEDADAVTSAVQRITAPHVDRGEIRVYAMKKLWEIRPPIDWDKGKAVEVIARELKTIIKLERLLTIYLGDDTTDEDAFRVVRPPDGWSIFVGEENRTSNADYFLNSTAEVEEFLVRLSELK
jgi:trehalose 6-phosphate phosphatase